MSDVTYKIRVNRPCYLYIDGEQVAFLREMQLEKITLPQGRYIRRVVALDNESIYDEKVITKKIQKPIENKIGSIIII